MRAEQRHQACLLALLNVMWFSQAVTDKIYCQYLSGEHRHFFSISNKGILRVIFQRPIRVLSHPSGIPCFQKVLHARGPMM